MTRRYKLSREYFGGPTIPCIIEFVDSDYAEVRDGIGRQFTFHISNVANYPGIWQTENEITVEEQLRQDLRITGNAYYCVENGIKMRIDPLTIICISLKK